MGLRALLIVNPHAKSTTAARREVVVQALASAVKLRVEDTSRRGDATTLARQAVSDGYEAVVALGGDGTANETVNGLLADGPHADLPAFAVIPGGCGNVFARLLGLPADPVESSAVVLAALRAGRRRVATVGRAEWVGEVFDESGGAVSDRYFTVSAELGVGAEMTHAVQVRRMAGQRSTTVRDMGTAMRVFFKTDRRRPGLIVTEPAGDERLALAKVANKPVGPDSSVGFDVIGLRMLPLRSILNLLHVNVPLGDNLFTARNAEAVDFAAHEPMAFQLDGDYLGVVRQLRCRNISHALRVIA